MTHDELLARVGDDEKFLEQYFGAKFKGQSALRAVVELAGKLQDQDPFHEDAGWNAGYNHAMYEVIEAIEKELK